MATIFNQIVEKLINEETGEITEKRETQAMRFSEEPPYVKLYLKDIMYLSDLPTNYSNVVYQLARRATYASEEQGMVVSLTPYTKKQITKTINIKITTLDNILTKLVKGKILYRLGLGTYLLNPYLLGKGNWADVSSIRLKIDYSDIEGKTFGAVIKYKNGNEKENIYEEAEPPEY